MSKLPKFSVITPSFNQGPFIRETIESVLRQKYPNFEHIVIDGGSTDETVSILKSYPHLTWVSEKDGGQADALNKGFARASGDIIAWINSDDWYAEGAFAAVAEAIQRSPVVLGDCDVVDQNGKPLYRVANQPSNWFDVLKYWIPYSIPTQPSIFFTRAALDEVRREEQLWVDPDLYICMDYDLWVRLGITKPFVNHIPKVLSYYRMTENNKTNHNVPGMAYAEPEMSLVFKRAETIALAPTISMSFVITVGAIDDAMVRTIESILLQNVQSFEIVVVCYGLSKEGNKQVKEIVAKFNDAQQKLHRCNYLRFYSAEASSHFGAAQVGINHAEGRGVTVAPSGALFSSDFLLQAVATLANDRIGFALPVALHHECAQHFKKNADEPAWHGTFDCKLEKHMTAPALPEAFVARRIALLDTDDLSDGVPAQQQLRRLSWLMGFRGWHVVTQAPLRVTTPALPESVVTQFIAAQNMINAEIICELGERSAARQGSVNFSPELVAQAKAAIARLTAAPQ